MKKVQPLIVLLGLLFGYMAVNAQTVTGEKDLKYRRNSLHLIILESEEFPRKETVMKAYGDAPFPEKYNNHSIGFNSFDPKQYTVGDAEKKTDGAKKGLLNNMGGAALSGATSALSDNDGSDMPLVIDKFIKDKKVANQLIAKWFNRQADGSFDMKLVGERGSYNASEMEANIAKGSARGTASLADAGEELIKNTFVVFTKLKFVSNEPVAAAIRLVAKTQTAKLPFFAQTIANKAADAVYNKTKEGYSVWTTSYLYRLKWNDTTSAIFYDKYWMDKTSKDLKKKDAFMNSNEFEMEFVGSEKSSTLVTFSLKSKRTEDETVALATVRNVENVFAKLQKSYDVFKPKTPLFSGEPITAKIGMKEGLEGGEKFEVLEQTVDPKTGLTAYLKKGTITVDKNSIWDNRYNAGTAEDEENKKDKDKVALDRTTFKGGKNYFAGMLIRQIK
ncbi:hypothetical protein FA048_04220 [Pedobacter polaris]|uniref:Uncharacterized protein n=1 Tax=Pedobacter polaris TaxID=2571273 RepID=A0A4U1CYS6_9SPHI|nr:hypothetical protein [Pedobacter polaris]TKC12829.1 hypothetical protein FA048_04220 [Pedobacter polaris]